MKKYMLSAALLLAIAPAFAQKYMTRTARISFFSQTPVENIQAINNEASCVLDAQNGALELVVPINSFKFEKALMQEHFNENYMESSKYPKADFKGRITNIATVNMGKDGVYKVQAAGSLTMHGVMRDVNAPGTVTVKGGVATAEAVFGVRCADYNIKVPSVVAAKIAEEIRVTVTAPLAEVKR